MMLFNASLCSFSDVLLEPLRNGLDRPKAVRGEGVKMINMGELFAHGRIGDIQMDRVLISDAQAQKCLLHPEDLLFARQSLVLSGAGKCSIFTGASEPVTYESHLIRARIDRTVASPVFYYYFFSSSQGRATMETIVEQVAAAGIRGSDLARLKVPCPPLIEQRAIASVLGALDDKIELNRRMNQTLESIAQALFKSWFVDFDPVHAKLEGRALEGMDAETAALFPSEFEDSELGQIPKGWKWQSLGEVAQNLRVQAQPRNFTQETAYIGLEHMPRKSIALDQWGFADKVVSNKFAFSKGQILFGKLRPYFHKVGIAPVGGVCSTDILVLAPLDGAWRSLVLGHVTSNAFIDYCDTGEGSKMPRTDWGRMASYPIPIPPIELAAAATNIMKPLIDKIVANIHENRLLAQTRDALLPKLISGEIRVRDAERTQ